MRPPNILSVQAKTTKAKLLPLVAAAIVLGSCYFMVIGATAAHPGPHARRALIQPPARSASHGSALALCPSTEGLEYFNTSSVKAAAKIAGRFGNSTRAADLASSDRAWWPEVRHNWAGARGSPISHLSTTGVRRLVDSPDLGQIISRACGKGLVSHTEVVFARPTTSEQCDACGVSIFFVDRRKHALVYYIY
jgi:hypothetical protein